MAQPNQLLSITPDEPRPKHLLSITEGSDIPSESLARTRAEKAHFGLGEDSPGIDFFYQNLIEGREKDTREFYARALENKNLRNRYDQIVERSRTLEGSGLTEDEIQFYSTMSQQQMEEPFSSFEKGYANEFINRINRFADDDPDNILNQAFAPSGSLIDSAILSHMSPPELQALKETGKDMKRKQAMAQKRLEDAQEAMSKQSWGGFGLDIAKFAIPLYSAVKLHESGSSLLSGENLDDQIRDYYTDTTGRGEEEFNRKMDQYINDNPLLATYYAGSFLERTRLESVLDSAFDIVDVATVGWGVTKPIAKAALIKKAVRDAIRISVKDADEARIAAEAGAVDTAVTTKVAREAMTDYTIPKDPLKQFEDLVPQMPSLYGMRGTMNTGDLVREALTRLRDHYKRNQAVFREMLKIGGPERLTVEQVRIAVRSEWENLKTRFNNINDALIDYDIIYAQDTADRVNYGVYWIGKTDGTLFKSIEEARNSAKFYGLDQILDAETIVKSETGKAYIQIVRPLREGEDAVRDAALTLKNMKTPDGLLPTVFRMIRSPEYTMSEWNLQNRKAATYAPNMYKDYMKVITDDIRKTQGIFRKNEEQALNKILNHNNLMPDPKNPDKRGYFYKTVGDLQDAYHSIVGRAPTEREIHGYFAITDLYDMDLFWRQLAVHKHQSLLGMENIRFRYKPSKGDEVVSEFFTGRYVDNLPSRASHDAVIYLRSGKDKEGRVFAKSSMTDAEWNHIQDLVKNKGYKVIETYSPLDENVKKLTGKSHDVNFIVTNTSESKRLDWKKFEHRGGGHVINEYDAWLKVPRVKKETIGTKKGRKFRTVYQGDTPLMPFTTRAQAQEWAPKINAVLDLIWKRKFGEAKALADATMPDKLEYKQILKWTKDGTIPSKEYVRVLQTHQSVYATERASLLAKYPNLVDDTVSPYNHAKNAGIGFTGERNAPIWTIMEEGGKARWEPARTLDPIPTLNRAMNDLVKSRAVDDYRIGSIQNWIAEFGDLVDLPGGKEQFARNPYWHFYNSTKFLPGATQGEMLGRVRAAQTSREQIKQLLGTRSELGVTTHRVAQMMADTVYKRLGQGPSEIFDAHVLPKIKDPAAYIRSMTFHAKLGLFNWVQLLVQMNTMHHVLALSPTNATQGMAAFMATRMLMFTEEPKIIEAVAKKMKAFGWNEDEFLEAHKLLKETGMHKVGGEVSFLDDIAAPKLFDTGFGRVLDAGTMFFREGERAVRLTGWYTAYREFKKANPHKVIRAQERNEILQRADMLSINQTRASNSILQQGLPSLTVQFLTYQTRLLEQFVSNKLTWADRARLFGVYGMMYGFPISISGLSGVPVYDSIRSAAIDNGVDVHDPAIHQLMEGLYSTIIKLVSGQETNFAQRMGPQGFTNIQQFLRGDTAWWELVGGAGVSTIGDIVKAMDPLSHALGSIARDGGESFPIAPEDFVDVLKNWSSANNAIRTIVGVNTGKFVSRRDAPLTDVTPIESLLLGAFGLSPLEITDGFLKAMSSKERQSFYEGEGREIARDIQRALRMGNDDPEQAKQYLKRATTRFTATGMPPHMISRILNRAIQGEYINFAEGINWPWLRSLPVDKLPKAMEQFSKDKQKERSEK